MSKGVSRGQLMRAVRGSSYLLVIKVSRLHPRVIIPKLGTYP